MVMWLFSDDELERLRSFPDIGKDELIDLRRSSRQLNCFRRLRPPQGG
jgi:hypothetical protein